MVKGVGKKKSVADQFAIKYKPETHYWAQKQNREDLELFRLNNLLDWSTLILESGNETHNTTGNTSPGYFLLL